MPAEPSLLRDATPAEQALAAGVAGNADLLPKTAPVSPRVKITIKKFEWGDKGARRTIKDVARMARDHRNDPFVRAWVVQKIWEGRAAGKDVDSPMTRAQVLLEAVQREFVYVSDPTGTEMIVAPKWLVQGFIPGGDCDDMVFLTATALLIALSSSGMRCAVLGHSYDQSEALSHILVAVYAPDSRDPNKGKWFYADPCTKLPLGPPVAPPTWELVYDPMEPDAPICDANACLANPQVKPARITWPHADLVGVAGPPTLDSSPVTLEGQPMSLEVLEPSLSSPPPPPVVPDSALPGVAAPPSPAWSSPVAPVVATPPWQAPRTSVALVQSSWQNPEAPVALVKAASALGEAFEPAPEVPEPQRITEEVWPAWRNWLISLRDAVQLDAYNLNDKYEQLRSLCNDAQIPFPPQVPGAVWDATQSTLFSKAMQFVTDALTFLQDAIDGKRDVLKVAPPDQLALPSAQQAQDLGIASLPADSIRYTLNNDVYAIPVPQAVPVAAAKFVSSIAGVGLLPFLLPAVSGAAVAITVGMIFHGRALIAALKESIEHITTVLLMREMGNLADKGWTPDQVQAGLGKVNQGIVDRKDAEVRRLEEEKKIIEAENNKIKTTLDRILWIGGLALLGVGGVWAWNNFGKPYMAARSSGSGSAPSEREPETTSHRGPASRPSDIHEVPTEPIPRRPGAIHDDPTKVSPVYQGNPYQNNPAQDAFTLMDQLNRHIAWGELDETKKLAREAIEEWQYGHYDRIDQLLLQMTLNRRPMWAPLVELLAEETETLASGLQYRPAFIQWARKQGIQVS